MNKRIDDALVALNDAQQLNGILNSLTSFNSDIEKTIIPLSESGGSTSDQDKINSFRSKANSLHSITRLVSARKLFIEIARLEEKISITLINGLNQAECIEEFKRELDSFAEAYNSYTVYNNSANALILLKSANSLKISMNNIYGFLDYFRKNTSVRTILDNEAEFTLLLSGDSNLKDFAKKLIGLESLYSEICYALGISIAQYPSRISKIESGSIWIAIFGNSKAIEFMTSLMKVAIDYFHGSHTIDGKISSIPKQIKSLDSILDFTKKLKESGADVKDINEGLAKITFTITNNLNELLSGQPLVQINGEDFSVATKIQKLLLDNNSSKRIEYTENNSNKDSISKKDSSD